MKNWFFNTLTVFSLILFLVFAVCGQDFEVKIKISESQSDVAEVEGKFIDNNNLTSYKNWVFAHSLAGFEGLAERISDLKLSDNSNKTVAVRKLIAGEYLAEGSAATWKYRVNLEPQKNFGAKAHISWIEKEKGILMFRDILPQFQNVSGQTFSARVGFELPDGWKIITNEKKSDQNLFIVRNVDKAIFLIGKGWRETNLSVGSGSLSIATFGEWKFSEKDAVEFSSQIFESYSKIFGAIPNKQIQINLIPFKNQTGRWQAETRGNTVTIVSGDMPFETLSKQRLHEQLRHELFHLWIPNDLSLTGNYDWFYEGFAVYQSLRTASLKNRIRFEDFLETLGRAHYLANFSEQKISLIEASKQTKSGSNPQVYSKGMIVAFLCDTAVLRESKGKYSIEDVFREIYQKHNSQNDSQDGNEAILKILNNRKELRSLVENYVEGTEKIVLAKYLDALGIKVLETEFETRLDVKEKLKSREKDLLEKLGYNNWRNIIKSKK